MEVKLLDMFYKPVPLPPYTCSIKYFPGFRNIIHNYDHKISKLEKRTKQMLSHVLYSKYKPAFVCYCEPYF